MHRLLILTVLFLSLFVMSCEHQAESPAVYSLKADAGSIKYAVRQARDEVSWTSPIEPEALSAEPVGKNQKILFYPSAGFSGMMGVDSVYPVLEGFGSLDVSEMDRQILTGVNDFLKQLSRKTLSFSSERFEKPYEGVVVIYEASFLPEILSWTIGKPSFGSTASPSYEVPVQLVTEEGKCTIRIFLNPEKAAQNEVVIQQVMFGVVTSGE